MKILHVTPTFFPATYWGGTTYSVHRLCDALAQIPEIELRVLTTDSEGPKVRDRISGKEFPERFPAGYEVYYCRRWWGVSFSPGLFFRLWPMVRWADVVHLTAVYSAPTIPTLLLCKILKKPVVWSPRGALQHWEGTTRKRVKKVWESVCEALSDPARVMLHVTSEGEREDSCIRMKGMQAAVIPNGIDIPPADTSREWQPEDKLRLLALGRLHPIKGLENLLRALARLNHDVTLAICGYGEPDHRRALETLAHELSLQDRVQFQGKMVGDGKSACFQKADVCVVASFKENFCMVVAEALARGVPVIASRGTPWKHVEDVGCGVWVDNDPENLARAIIQMGQMPLQEMGQRGREWMEKEFAWPLIAEKMMRVYQKLARKQQA